MLHRFLNWRFTLFAIAIAIVTGTIFYSQYLARKIAGDERQKVEIWVEAEQFLINSPADADTRLVSAIIINNHDIPIIGVNESGDVIAYINLDSNKVREDPDYLNHKLRQFKSQHDPIVYTDPLNRKKDFYYYGSSVLLREVRYYPLVQLVVVALFTVLVLYTITIHNRSVQNQLWAGMAKETAHQLGTPVSSLEGWVAMLKEDPRTEKIGAELAKDVNRLQLVSDRFSKIGSSPRLEERDIISQIENVVDYIRRRSPEKIQFILHHGELRNLPVKISASLFDWVMENLLKNALDAIGEKGTITIEIDAYHHPREVIIDVTDTGKGITHGNLKQVFRPGFTTKKRGWGLGLTLSRRIIQEYHKGQLFVKNSEPGKGTTFRIILQREGES